MVGELKTSNPSSAAQSNLNELFAKAIEQHQAGRMEHAIELLRHLVLQFPGYAPAWNNLGVALRATDKFSAAASVLRRGMALNDQDADAWSNLGNARRSVGECEEAARAHQKSLTVDMAAGRVH